MQELGVHVCADLQKLKLQILKDEFGTNLGQKLQDLSFGIDHRQVNQKIYYCLISLFI